MNIKNFDSCSRRANEKKEELMPWQTSKILKTRVDQESIIPDPSESSVHGKEIHVAKQHQTQKEVCTVEIIFYSKNTSSFFRFRYKVTKKYTERLLLRRRPKWNTPVRIRTEWSKEKS